MIILDEKSYILIPNIAKGSSLASCTFINKDNGRSYYAKSGVYNTIEQSFKQALKEQIALSVYSIFNIPVPAASVYMMRIMYSQKSYNNELLGLPNSRTHAYYVCTELVSNAVTATKDALNEPSVAQILATSILINDIDVLGGNFNNILVSTHQNGDTTIYKIDAGESFYPDKEVNLEQLRFCTQGENTSINLGDLSHEMRRSFLNQLLLIAETPTSTLCEQIKSKLGAELYCSNRKWIDTLTDFMVKRKDIIKEKLALNSMLSSSTHKITHD